LYVGAGSGLGPGDVVLRPRQERFL
jgi:hypothetical protein